MESKKEASESKTTLMKSEGKPSAAKEDNMFPLNVAAAEMPVTAVMVAAAQVVTVVVVASVFPTGPVLFFFLGAWFLGVVMPVVAALTAAATTGSETGADIVKGQQASGSSCGKNHETGNQPTALFTFLKARYESGNADLSVSAVAVALSVCVFYWVDMAMNYNYFKIIPETAVETWQQMIPLGLNAKRSKLPPLFVNIFVNHMNFCSILSIWTCLEINHGLAKTAFLATICSLGGSMVQAMLPLPLPFFVASYYQISGAWGFSILLWAILHADVFMNWNPSSAIVAFCVIAQLPLTFIVLYIPGLTQNVGLLVGGFILALPFVGPSRWWSRRKSVKLTIAA